MTIIYLESTIADSNQPPAIAIPADIKYEIAK
jgi:hypothetical protein